MKIKSLVPSLNLGDGKFKMILKNIFANIFFFTFCITLKWSQNKNVKMSKKMYQNLPTFFKMGFKFIKCG
jgi:hypothetical protein